MVDVAEDVLRPPHCTTPAAVKANKNQKSCDIVVVFEHAEDLQKTNASHMQKIINNIFVYIRLQSLTFRLFKRSLFLGKPYLVKMDR